MFFLGFVFAYFYLRSLNNNDLWRPAGVDPPTGYGIAIVACLRAQRGALRLRRAGGPGGVAAGSPRRASRWSSGLLGCVLQGFEYAHLSFGPAERRLRQRLLRLDGALRRWSCC